MMFKVSIRKIQEKDNTQVARIIKTVMPEFGASSIGFAIHDKEVDNMFAAFDKPESAYFVADVNGKIVGGAGVAPLKGGDESICELQKMYFLPEARGKGYGREVLQTCLREARAKGYRQCYIETFNTMKDAIALYEKYGFKKIPGALGNTGHFACDTFYILDLQRNH